MTYDFFGFFLKGVLCRYIYVMVLLMYLGGVLKVSRCFTQSFVTLFNIQWLDLCLMALCFSLGRGSVVIHF